MQLNWSNQAGIAQALLSHYPEQDRLALSLDDLAKMIMRLPGISAPPPSLAHLESVLWTWIRLADSEGA